MELKEMDKKERIKFWLAVLFVLSFTAVWLIWMYIVIH